MKRHANIFCRPTPFIADPNGLDGNGANGSGAGGVTVAYANPNFWAKAAVGFTFVVGSGFTNNGDETVFIGATNCPIVQFVNVNQIEINPPVIQPGTYDLTYTCDTGSFTLPNAITVTP
jgi:hypothetical protein